MVQKVETFQRSSTTKTHKDNVKADVIILGCSIPGIVAAHKLKRKFGDSMAIVVLDLACPAKTGRFLQSSKCNVAFQEDSDVEGSVPVEEEAFHHIMDNVARHYIAMYAKNFNIPLPDCILSPERNKSSLHKVFQNVDGKIVDCLKDYHDFEYVNFLEKFELNQYQTVVDQTTRDIFQMERGDAVADKKQLLYFDQTTMEQHICNSLLFPTSRNIMRTIVRLICGASAESVSVLFYLHQCHRTSTMKNHIDGRNTRFREKLLGYCRKRLASKLQQSIADITLQTKSIEKISTYSDEQVILKTIKGENDYVCSLLAMALRPDELNKIQMDDVLLSETEALITQAMKCGKAKKFVIHYENNFWQEQGYSGDILSLKGPILWAMERPKMSTTGSIDKYASLIGYLKIVDDKDYNQNEVVAQLVKLFGEKAETPVTYRETDIDDVFVPRRGDYIALKKLTGESRSRHLEWGALDVFAEGDVAAALEAGHVTYLHLLSTLRPQATTFEDISSNEIPIILSHDPFTRFFCHVNYKVVLRLVAYSAIFYAGVRLLRHMKQ